MKAQILRQRLCDIQVCVPAHWADEQVERFANTAAPIHEPDSKWGVVKEGDVTLANDQERTPCARRDGFVHIRLEYRDA